MTMKPLLAWSLALAVFAVAAPGAPRAAYAEDDEKPVKSGDVPKVVRDALEKKYPKCTVKKWESETEAGKTVFEAGIEAKTKDKDGKEATHKIDVSLSAEGKILAEEEKVAQDSLPDAIKKAWADSKYAKAKVLRVERIIKEEKADDPSYEFGAELEGKKVEVVLDKAGKIVKEEADDEGDEKDEGKGGDTK